MELEVENILWKETYFSMDYHISIEIFFIFYFYKYLQKTKISHTWPFYQALFFVFINS